MLKPKVKITKKEIRKDPLLETVNNAFDKFNRNKQMITRIGIGLLSIIVLVIFYTNRQSAKQKPADIIFGKALVLLDTGDIENAQFQFELLSDNHESTEAGRLSLYFLGSILFNKEEFEVAKSHLIEFVSNSKNDGMLASAHIMLSGIFQQQLNLKKEEDHLQLALKHSANKNNQNSIELILAEYYAQNGKNDMALAIVEKIQAFDNVSSNDKKKAEELSGMLSQ